jgi:phosphoribosylformylglycinamidine synthase
LGHLSCSIFEREILKVENQKNPPKVNLIEEKKNSEFVRNLISQDLINSCHDISDGGLLVTLFEKSTKELGCKIDISSLKNEELNDDNAILFGEDQSRYVISISNENLKDFLKIAEQNKVAIFKIGEVIKENINLNSQQLSVVDLQKISQITFEKNFS